MSSRKKYTDRDFKGNVRVTVSEREVRIWVCNDKGINIFRFKALGKVYEGEHDVMVIGDDFGK